MYAQASEQCSLDSGFIINSHPLEATRTGGRYDGREGIDTFRIGTARTFSPRPERHISFETFDLRNDLFTVFVVDAQVIATTDTNEIEVLADDYDQVILDPRYEWDSHVDSAFRGIAHVTTVNEEVLTLRTSFDTYVIGPNQSGVRVSPAPRRDVTWPLGHGSRARPALHNTVISDSRTIIRWDDAGIVLADIREIEAEDGIYEFDVKNGLPNALVIDINEVVGPTPRQLHITADAEDRLILLQQPCWSIDRAGNQVVMRTLENAPQSLSIMAESELYEKYRVERYIASSARSPGVRHLSSEGRRVIDGIDLKNRGKDTLIIRNTPHLREDFPVFIRADEGDEVWLEGSAGWELQFRDYGVFATVPAGFGGSRILWFEPGTIVSILPPAPGLSDPKMLDLGFYPGTKNEPSDGTGLIVSRSGGVAFSQAQLQGKSRVSFENGAANTIRLSPDIFDGTQTEILLVGDPGLDLLAMDDMPAHRILENGNIVWQIQIGTNITQTITADGFHILAEIVD